MVIWALWHRFRLGHEIKFEEIIYPGVSTRVCFCSCGRSWDAPPGYRDDEHQGPNRF